MKIPILQGRGKSTPNTNEANSRMHHPEGRVIEPGVYSMTSDEIVARARRTQQEARGREATREILGERRI